MTQIPLPLYKKMILTAFAGAGCMLFGLVYYFAAKDDVLLILSLVLLVNCAVRAFSLYRIAVKEQYETVSGTCVSVSTGIIGKFKTVCMVDDAGAETTLRITKSCKLKIGGRYRLYFDNRHQHRTGAGFIDKALATGSFLGYEREAS